ncbi:hypothetical protein N7497_010916 [Penicillium chrysogenum]|jgi:hypothetical protein|uniref:Uncharacterized protein n=1 Tax=Penicillium chrysogenum TaxID=5076 RepID=A0ABQ8W8K2_PENCH|nr:hypothetical protein N7524_010843 [Penicillium chrysogenum]KAJ5260254.1 hypothetical protein N7505_009635 [Penicillium chrysogenum]KAJ6141817.1 hypothetical protein N7497_010916 [Penicillium chrysogenum]
MPEKFPPGFVLGEVAKSLDQHHGDLRIGISTDLVTYDEAPDSKSKLRARHSWPCPVANDESSSSSAPTQDGT